MTIRRLVRSDYELQDAADAQDVSIEDAARDLALLSVMASLSERFGPRVVFKGGAVLRFGHGASRTSRDTDATVVAPAKAPIPADEVRQAIVDARMGQFLQIGAPADPLTANRYSLDFDKVSFACSSVKGTFDVELSFREDLVLSPRPMPLGMPYFASFEVLTMRPVEMAGEKLRTLVQRQRGTDLSDCVLLDALSKGDRDLLPQVRLEKFKLVRDGVGLDQIRERIDALDPRYEADVRAVDPEAPDYETARRAAMSIARSAWA